MRYHDPERIQGYCRACEKYGRFWSCPPFASSPLARLAPWTEVVVVCQKTMLAEGIDKDELTERFLEARHRFVARVLAVEAGCAQATALVAGHCSCCSSCTRETGEACRSPARLRYSLEAVGFDVTGLAEGLAGQKVHWPKQGLPDYLLTVGALLCPTRESAEAAHVAFGNGRDCGCPS